jgi:LEA14-like dessication related protein
MRRGNWKVVVAVLLVLGLGCWIWWNSKIGKEQKKSLSDNLKPTISVTSVNVNNIDDDKVSMTTKVVLKNPLPVEIKTDRLDYVVMIDSVKVIEEAYNKPITIRSSDSTTITLPMNLRIKPMNALLKRFDRNDTDSAQYILKAKMQVDVPIAGERKFDLNLDKRLPAVRLFKIKPQSVEVDKLGLKESSLDMVINIENPGVVPMKFADGSYSVTLDNDEAIEGRLEKTVVLPAKGSDDVAMHVDIKTGKAAKLAWKALFDKDGTPFKVDFKCKVISENEAFNNSNMAFKIQGTLDDLKKK